MRVALIASVACKEIARQSLSPQELEEHAVTYEKWAIKLLDALDLPSRVMAILSLVPLRRSGEKQLWEHSLLDFALDTESFDFIAHHHCQHLLLSFWCGDFPCSPCMVKKERPLVWVAVQVRGPCPSFALPNLPKLAQACQNLCCRCCGLYLSCYSPSPASQLPPLVQAWQPAIAEKEITHSFHSLAYAAYLHTHPPLSPPVVARPDHKIDEGAIKDLQAEAKLEASERSIRRSTSSLGSDPFYTDVWASREQLVNNAQTWLEKAQEGHSQLLGFFDVPKCKFTLHMVSDIIFVGLLSYFLTLEPTVAENLRRTGELPDERVDIEVMLWLWTFSKMVQEGLGAFFLHRDSGNPIGRVVSSRMRDVWNRVDMLTYFLVLCIVVLRLGFSYYEHDMDAGHKHILAHKLARNTYALLVWTMYIRLLQYAMYWQGVGVLVIILSEMLYDILIFIVLLSVNIIGAGVAFMILLPGLNAHEFWGARPFMLAVWAVIGDFDVAMVEQYSFQGSHMAFDEDPTTYVAPIFLFAFVFVTTVVLVNLLIAQMSHVYEDVKQVSQVRWQFAFGELVREFKDVACPLPPPFSVLWLLIDRALLWRGAYHRMRTPRFHLTTSHRRQVELQLVEAKAMKRCIEEEAAAEKESLRGHLIRLKRGQQESATVMAAFRHDTLSQRSSSNTVRTVA